MLTAAASIVVLLLMILVNLLLNGSARGRTSREVQCEGEKFEDLFRAAVDPAVADWIKKNPVGALMLSLVAGAAASYSGSTGAVIRGLLTVVADISRDQSAKREAKLP